MNADDQRAQDDDFLLGAKKYEAPAEESQLAAGLEKGALLANEPKGHNETWQGSY